ncbi:tRNA pseudouridine(55) synthase TruB [Bacteroidales bacterium OttesenSCG-928-K03]|nr:tRNA pseudouridine(55) synthase TruB [Odoribacter sp. OttesenSCG-928-L07]MDL2239008.1 tRNA pseudouridine(55) synthase TruB [Bacteroidales bacterium OttesenSCG-928-L14]MDL2240704.1 tRNA pseudouridine(55) synthase TruB [Bacteroidales bacterium OttesenSCG-928-K22]MDL2242154.1 tRNA pseudouridine(55) synthase TruB [Bacteroidales bacterium OttesenSCG-928-K03]
MSYNFQEGELLLFDKPYNWTSFDVVNKVKVFLKYYCHDPKIKVGHAGTLDPLATGLVIVCTGKKTKEIDLIQAHEKEYEGIITIGATRPSFDKETAIDKTSDYSFVTEKDIIEVSKQFLGKQQQIPPVYSAVKIDGVRAYEHARKKNFDIEKKLQPRDIEIFNFEIKKINLPEITFKINCSKGTYIRSIARDFGEKLGCGAYLEELRRTAIGSYRVEDAMDIDSFKEIILSNTNN